MIYKNEKQLLLVIRYTLPLLILILSVSINTFLFYKQASDFKEVKEEIEERYIVTQKQVIKNQIDNIYNFIVLEQKETETKLKNSLINRVNEAHTIIINLYNQYKDTLTKEEMIPMFKSAIKDIRFNNGRGYFFVYDKKATNIIHPLIPRFEGKNLFDYQDTKGTYVLRESIELLKNNDSAYQEWYWRKAKNDNTEYKKIGFVKNIYELDWFIGTGEYVEDFSKDVQKSILKQIEKLKFGNNSYFIVTNKDGDYISHINKNLIGKNSLEKLKEMNDFESINKIKYVISNKKGYVYLDFFKPNSKIISSKIIYLKTIPNWAWVVSTGFYKEDVELLINEKKEKLTKIYNENLENLATISILTTFILLLITFFISNLIEKKFKLYKTNIQHHIEKNQKQNQLLAQKSKLAAMGEMMENIAHQWRQPLSLITSAASAIKLHKSIDKLDDNFLESSLDSINNSAFHLSQTIEDFRDFFKPDKEKTVFTLKSSIEKTHKLLSSQFLEKEITIVENIEDISIENFERELLQVLLNILNNAKDAFSLNSELTEKEKYIFINIYKTEKNVVIQIKDNAGGIKDDVINRVFEPYFTTKHKSQGTGIGLYMSQEIISKHMNGTITVSNTKYEYQNSLYKGALFTIKIPSSEV